MDGTNYKEIEGNLITLALENNFDVIVHGVNCFCKQKSGLAKQMSETYETHKFSLEDEKFKGDMNKLGMIDYEGLKFINNKRISIGSSIYPNQQDFTYIVNAYTQYRYGRNKDVVYLDMTALDMCLKKINHFFKGKHIGLPMIGCGLANGAWYKVQHSIQKYLTDCEVTVVKFKQ